MNLLEINARIRQRPPFQMIERVTALEPGKSADGITFAADGKATVTVEQFELDL